MRWPGARVVVDQRDRMPELFAARYPNAPRALTPALRWLEQRLRRSFLHRVLSDPALTLGGRRHAQ
jgi:hypothetical protein